MSHFQSNLCSGDKKETILSVCTMEVITTKAASEVHADRSLKTLLFFSHLIMIPDEKAAQLLPVVIINYNPKVTCGLISIKYCIFSKVN